MKCHYCGAEIPNDTTLHCPACGAPMDSVTQQLVSYHERTRVMQGNVSSESEEKPASRRKPVRHTHLHAQKSQRALMIIAAGLFFAILAVLLLAWIL